MEESFSVIISLGDISLKLESCNHAGLALPT